MRIVLILFFSLSIFALQAQLVNQGGTITVKSGASLVVQSDITNSSGSIVLESGATLDVSGDFTNAATMNFNAASQTIFSGTANSDVTSGGGVFGNLQVDKTSANVVLLDAMTINGQLDFAGSNNKVVLGNYDLTMGSGGTVTGASSNEYVVATGSGKFIKPISANGTLTFEVGDNVASTNYSPLTAAITGSYSSANVGVNVVNAVHPDKPGTAPDYLTRYWNVQASGITGYSANLTGTFIPGNDVVGTQANIDGASWDGANWDYTNAAHSGNTVSSTATNTNVGFTGFTKNTILNLTAFIEGYMNGSTMRPVLLNSGVPGATGSQCDNLTVELRSATAPYGLVHTFTGIINTNGTMTCTYPGAVSGNSYFVVLKHRNALETWSASPVLFGNSTNYSFASGSGQAYGSNMVQVGGVWCMYSGDIDGVPGDGNIDNFDYPVWELDYFNFLSGYFRTDLNGDGNVDNFDYPIWELNYFNFISVQKP